jgi:hypothetical protein
MVSFSRIDILQADFIAVRENPLDKIDPALLSAFKGQEAGVINGEVSLHRDYRQQAGKSDTTYAVAIDAIDDR